MDTFWYSDVGINDFYAKSQPTVINKEITWVSECVFFFF